MTSSPRCAPAIRGRLPRLAELYGKITTPTLVLWAGRDKHFPVAHAERLHAALPNSRLNVLPGAEHWMPWYRADEVASSVEAFLAES